MLSFYVNFSKAFSIALTTIAWLLQTLTCISGISQISQTAQWGNVSGKIVVNGEAPTMPPEKVGNNKDRAVCLVDGEIPPDDQLVVDPSGGLRDVFVILIQRDLDKPIPVHPSYDKAAETTLELDNVNCRFVPHAMAIRTGQPLNLKNSDRVGHNCKITSFNNEHNVNLPAGGETEIKLEAADRLPANVSCDVHPWMDALILAKDHPYVAITEADGSFELKNVPSGQWKLQFWHQRVGYLRKLDVTGSKVDRKGRIDVKIARQGTSNLGTLRLPASAIK